MAPFVQVIFDLQRSIVGHRDRCFCLCGCRLTQGRHDSETGDDPVLDWRGGVKNGSRPPSEKRIGFISRFCPTATAAGHDGLLCPSVTSRLFCQDGVVGSAAGRTVMTGGLAECVLPSLGCCVGCIEAGKRYYLLPYCTSNPFNT